MRAVLWQGIWLPGAEWCELEREPDGWRLSGTVAVSDAGEPVLAHYRIGLHANWATRDVRVSVQRGVIEPAWLIGLTVDARKRWQLQQGVTADEDPIPEELGAVQGLVDLDLGFTPATNTLPIRRLAPRIGEAVDVTAVWVRFPELSIEPLRQRYTRLGERTYRYESSGGAFVAEIEVDDLGLVVNYEGGWRRIAQASRED